MNVTFTQAAAETARLRVEIHGAVQGVGFRPFVYRLATDLNLTGWVINDVQGVFVEVEGPRTELDSFLERLSTEKPPRAIVYSVESAWLDPVGYTGFEIRHSQDQGAKTVLVLPDVATCPDCLAEVLDPDDRRWRYPFTNCTNCGPRFTIIEALPYDRPNTTMRRFTMCPRCQAEYDDPLDRRFHAQPNACPVCGPRLALWTGQGVEIAHGDAALRETARALGRGSIAAVKGLGGFHLMVDARNCDAVDLLRERKRRPAKPFALMVRDLDQARSICHVTMAAEALLTSAEAPIVLLTRKTDARVAPNLAPGNPNLGLMLPYTPLHHLLMRDLDFPVVATSGNLSDEPICTDQYEALERLGHIADLFLVHDRPIVRHADDSVAWITADEPRLLRRARGYAPLPVLVEESLPPILGVGAHLKNCIAMSVDRQVFISQHVGDLETAEALHAFERVIADFCRLYETRPVAIAHDLHPDYLSTKWAGEQAIPGLEPVPNDPDNEAPYRGATLIPVQHHHAHLAACLAENGSPGPALGVTWDGTGYGLDGTIWGGEFLLGETKSFIRAAHLRPFRLPGGEAAVKEPRRVALALLWEMMGREALERDDLAPVVAFSPTERGVLLRMLERDLNAPITTSAGRLFDGFAGLMDLHQVTTFEGQAAMSLEFAARPETREAYPMRLRETDPLILDWGPAVEALLADLQAGVAPGIMAARFHNGLVDAIVAVARHVGESRVALSGGCFQNRRLTEQTTGRLRQAGFEVLLHRQVPPNDGCICLGQVAIAAAQLKENKDFVQNTTRQ